VSSSPQAFVELAALVCREI